MASRFANRDVERITQYLPKTGPDVRALRVIPGGRDDSDTAHGYGDWSDGPRPDRRRRSDVPRVAVKALVVLVAFLMMAVVYLVARDGSFIGALGLGSEAPGQGQSALAEPVVVAQPNEPAAGPSVSPQPATAEASARPPLPDVPGLVILIRSAIVALQHANATGNYSVLREIAAPDFQIANSPAQLSALFTDLRARSLDLGTIVVVDPELQEPPVMDDSGLMRVIGFFEAGPIPVGFDLVFQWTDAGWRLFGIGVQPADAQGAEESPGKAAARVESSPPQLPDAATMVVLIRSAVIALNQANMTGNYSVLRELSAPGFQQANSFADLATIFAELRARELDLGPVAVIDPQLFRPAAVDERGLLRLTGFFASRPEQVNFDLAFQRVDGDWRLFGIGLNTSRTDPSLSSDVPPAAPSADPPDAPHVAPIADISGVAPPIPRLRPTPTTSE